MRVQIISDKLIERRKVARTKVEKSKIVRDGELHGVRLGRLFDKVAFTCNATRDKILLSRFSVVNNLSESG